MDQLQNIYGLIIGFVAVAGGMGIGLYAVHISVTSENRRKMAAEEARHKERLALIEKGMDPLLAEKKLPKDYTQGLTKNEKPAAGSFSSCPLSSPLSR
jgi:hypothetical protein